MRKAYQKVLEHRKMEEKSMGEITISTKEYKELIESQVRVQIFSDFVRKSEYRIDREECASYLNFSLGSKEAQDEDGTD